MIEQVVKVDETELKKTIIEVIGANELEIGFGLESINAKPDGKDISNRCNQEQTINALRCQ